ncbi:hypothetical protein ABXJ76_05605 [Methylobacter sp. G7]|uniref:hypothetical protein n=1 Tax=Methylobacter sp. G7 TaxID=3230117 RepID=UPI003D8030CE
MLFIDITQDGAGIVQNNDPDIDGLLTGNISTCCVYIFYGEKSFSIVHDTGQLQIGEISAVANKCGILKSAFYAINPTGITKAQSDSHRIRKKRINNLLKLKKGMKRINIPSGNVICLKTGGVLTQDEDILAIPANLTNIPHREVRNSINELNNLFSAKNSQSLPIDFQFDGNGYTSLPKLLKTAEEMLAIATLKMQHGDSDYLAFLEKAKRLGVFAAS